MQRLSGACDRVGKDQGPKLREAICGAGVRVYESHQRATLRMRRARTDFTDAYPLTARYGRGAIVGLARVLQLFVHVGSSRSIDQANEVLDTVGGTDSAAERMLREGLLDACREYPVMMRRIQDARRTRVGNAAETTTY